MAKRKISEAKEEPKEEPVKEEPEEDEEEDDEEGSDEGEENKYQPGPMDTNPIQFLIAPKDFGVFTKETWESAPLYVPATAERKEFFEGLFDFSAICRVADQMEAGAMILMDQDPGEKGDALNFDDDVDDEMIRTIGPLVFGRDVRAVRYIDGAREEIRGSFADSETLRELHDTAGATLQLLQPQRFINGLWRLVSALEAQCGCLVGVNAYITPPNGQGLAPHNDDVELFICQTQGTKKWKLYKPHNDFALPSRSSGDLKQEEIGEPIMEVTLSPGDVLYMPRGTVHQAAAQEEGSCHVTVSTYQSWTYGSLAEQVVRCARSCPADPASCLPLDLRRGLPLGAIYKHGLQADLSSSSAAALVAAVRPDAAAVAAGLRSLAAALEAHPVELLSPAVEAIAEDFLINRMPPHPCQLPEQGEEPTLEDSLAGRGSGLFRLVAFEQPEGGMSDEEDEDEEDEDEDEAYKEAAKGPHVKLVTPLANSRFTHMIGKAMPDEEEDSDDEDGHVHGAGCGHDHHAHGSDDESDGEGEEEEEKEEKVAKGKKGGAKGKKEESEDEDIDDVDMAEMMGGSDEGEDEEDEESEEEEEKELPGPIFPAAYASVLAAVLAATPTSPLPVKALQVPGGSDEERLRLAVLLFELGCVVTVPKAGAVKKEEEGVKKEEKAPAVKKAAPKGKEEKAAPAAAKEAKKEPTPKKDTPMPKKGKKEAPKAKAEEAPKAKVEEKGAKAGKGAKKESAEKKEAPPKEEKTAAAPPAKKAKKGGK